VTERDQKSGEWRRLAAGQHTNGKWIIGWVGNNYIGWKGVWRIRLVTSPRDASPGRTSKDFNTLRDAKAAIERIEAEEEAMNDDIAAFPAEQPESVEAHRLGSRE